MPKLTFNSQVLASIKHAKAAAASVNAVYNAIRSWTVSSLSVDSLLPKAINSMHYQQPPSKFLVGACADTSSVAEGTPLCSVLHDPSGVDAGSKIILVGFIWVHNTLGDATFSSSGKNQQIDVKIGGAWRDYGYYFGAWDKYLGWNGQQRELHGYNVLLTRWNSGVGGGPIPDSVCNSGGAGINLQFGGAQCAVLTRVFTTQKIATATEWGLHGSTQYGANTTKGTARLFAIVEDRGS